MCRDGAPDGPLSLRCVDLLDSACGENRHYGVAHPAAALRQGVRLRQPETSQESPPGSLAA